MSQADPPIDLEALMRRPEPGSHRTTVVVADRRIESLADLPPRRSRLLFVGLQPSMASVDAGHYHQDSIGRTFWRRLIVAGILPAQTDLDTADDALIATGHGITDLLKTPVEPESDGTPNGELTAGVGPLWQKIALWRPAAVVFLDRRAAEIAAGRTLTERWGQLVGVALAGRPCFLMPAGDAPRDEVDEALNYLRNLGAALPYE